MSARVNIRPAWFLQFSGPASTPDWHISDAQGVPLFTIGTETMRDRDRVRAVATVATLAPELLDALEKLMQYHELMGCNPESSAMVQARALIERAGRGLQPGGWY